MKPGRKRVILRAMAVLVIVLGVIVLAFLPPEDPPETEAEAKARRLIAELRGPSAFREWLIKLGAVQASRWRDPDTIVSELAALGQGAVPVCIRALRDDDWHVRYCVALALGRIGPEAAAAVPALIEALRDADTWVRYYAAEALGEIGPAAKDAIPALTKALKDKDAEVPCAAAAALVKLGLPGTGLPVLVVALEDESASHRQWAAETLGELGAPAKAAIPALRKTLKDEDEDVRKAAAEALKKIQQEHPTTAPTRPAKGS